MGAGGTWQGGGSEGTGTPKLGLGGSSAPTVSLRGEPTVWDSRWHLATPEAPWLSVWAMAAGVPAARLDEVGLALATPEGSLQSLGGGLRSREAPDIPFWGCGREAKRNVKRCLKAPRKPVGLSRSSICGKKPWHGAASSTVKIDRGAEKRLNSGSQCPSAEEESLSKSRGGSAPLCCFPLNPSTKKRERDKS